MKVRLCLLASIVLALAIVGSFALTQNMAGPIMLATFAVIGWLMQRFDHPVAAVVVGLLLGRLKEGVLLRTYQMSGGELGFMLTRPIALAMLALLVVFVAFPYLRPVTILVPFDAGGSADRLTRQPDGRRLGGRGAGHGDHSRQLRRLEEIQGSNQTVEAI